MEITENIIVTYARNIIYGYTPMSVQSNSFLGSVISIKKELDRLKEFNLESGDSVLPRKRSVDEAIRTAANVSREDWKQVTEFVKTDFNDWIVIKKCLDTTETSSILEFLKWCLDNRFHLSDLRVRNYCSLRINAKKKTKVVIADLDGFHVQTAYGSFTTRLMPDVYSVKLGKDDPINIELYKDVVINE